MNDKDLTYKFAIVEARAKNLLARIHRDGGQHTESVGLEASLVDAEKVVVGFLSAEARVAELEAALAAATETELAVARSNAECELAAAEDKIEAMEARSKIQHARIETLANAVRYAVKVCVDECEDGGSGYGDGWRLTAYSFRQALRDAGCEE